ncbi:haloacid dehalogenase-like hydrolase [Tessaracoccus defluvii]|uniref:Haloacid dehalogenase-like hydrolase n=2 Tax=Tessaracoccus defluvii TaxID=1285901 RepID=A0A7H0H401_9ACTN|nr:haloacid dehalogenase-like hydrolase [Tessaracoccus defluvii]QNP55267.1 haloacid dehalogenase-like hydrolase [Tessaracoccus defluvii]
MTRPDLLEAITAAEGRTLICETSALTEPLIAGITNAEVAASLAADMILLNFLDVDDPVINGLPGDTPIADSVRTLKRLAGRPVGINLEPIDARYEPDPADPYFVPPGRRATQANALRAAELGVDLIVFTGNPGAGVSNHTIADAVAEAHEVVGDRLVLAAGRMHAAGVFGPQGGLLTLAEVDAFIDAGADIVLLPAPGTVPGVTLELVHPLVSRVHSRGALVMTTIGTSQEGSDEATMRQFALTAKMAGADLHHIGDAGYSGIATPENIFAYSIAVRGRRHTIARMARSVLR